MSAQAPSEFTDAGSEPELLSEARRLAAQVATKRLPFRLLGGLAVRIRQPSACPPLYERGFADIDFMSVGAGPKQIAHFAEGMGYTPDRQFNVVNGARRLIFYGPQDHKLEFFVNSFQMCQRVPMDRALTEPETVPLAELLLTKLQIVKLTEKDLQDVLVLVHAHAVTSSDGDDINWLRVAQCCAGDWGLWRTATLNLSRSQESLAQAALSVADTASISGRLMQLRSTIDAAPKSISWKLRARIGERLPWYDDPDEV